MNKLYNDTAVQAIANAIRAKNGSSDTYNIAEMSTALNDLSYYAKPTISNVALATFEADGLPLNSLKVSVEAKQDLHGYDKPWVAGGGKNILPMKIINEEVNDIIFTKISDIDGNALGFSMVGLCSSTTSRIIASIPIKAGTYILNGCNGGAYNSYALRIRDENDTSNAVWQVDGDVQITFASDTTVLVQVFIWQNTNVNQIIYPMLRKSGTSADFEPYSNICPISGWSEVNVSDVDDVDNPTVTQTTTISLGQTVYGGEVDVVNGILKITDGYIASYNGETLPSTWISSMDVYAEGTSPTTGAEVCYELVNPIIINLTPSLIKSLEGTNNLSADCGDVIELEYFKEV